MIGYKIAQWIIGIGTCLFLRYAIYGGRANGFMTVPIVILAFGMILMVGYRGAIKDSWRNAMHPWEVE
jgi:hypothetical protein